MAFGNYDTPAQVAQRKEEARYNLTNGYTGETFENLDAFDTGEKLTAWLEEDGYEFTQGEMWYDYQWTSFADGYTVEEVED